ncbi:MFS transporter [Methylobacterium sp. JK268]
MSLSPAITPSPKDRAPPREGAERLTPLFALAVGVVVLSLYASQPLIGPIGASFGLEAGEAGLVTTLTLLGYAGGLFLIVPLTDLVENRTVIVATLLVDVAALAAVAGAPTPPLFLLACFVAGGATSAIQMLVPIAARLAPEARRGRVVGQVMSGLMLGILLSRPAASLVAGIADWRWYYAGLSVLVAGLTLVLARVLPRHQPRNAARYPALIGSMLTLLREEPVLRRRAASQALCMGAFGVFWTSVALRLAEPPFSLGQGGIGLFALAGAAGAVIAPIAGRAGDRGRSRVATRLAHLAVIAAMALAALGGHLLAGGPDTASWPGLTVLVAGAVLLDLGVIGDQTLGRRAITLLRPEAGGRVNGLFTGLFFLGAAAGSGLSGIAWTGAGWPGVCAAGTAFGAAALALSLTEPRPRTPGGRGAP